jgi:hypothetical protein
MSKQFEIMDSSSELIVISSPDQASGSSEYKKIYAPVLQSNISVLVFPTDKVYRLMELTVH